MPSGVAAPSGVASSPLVTVEIASAVAADAMAGSGDDAGPGPRAQAGEFDLGPANTGAGRGGVTVELASRPDQSPVVPAAATATAATSTASTGPEGVTAVAAGAAGAQPAVTVQPAVSDQLAVVETATSPQQVAGQLADSVQRAVLVDGRELRMRLSPPELGQLEVRVVETSDGVRVSLVASTREAAELIQQQLPFLRSALEARDLKVDRLDVFSPELADGSSDGAPRDRTAAGGQGEDGPVWSPLAGERSQQEGTGDGAASDGLADPLRGAGTLDVLA